MKKLVASVAGAALLSPALFADQTVITAHEEPTIVAEQPEECTCGGFDGLNLMLGIGGSFLKSEAKNAGRKVGDLKPNRFIGTLGIGYGKTFNNVFYVGPEFLFDFTKNKTKKENDVTVAKMNGVFLSLGLRLGYVMPKYGTMLYFKVSGTHSKAERLIDANHKLKVSKISPALALGVEKSFCKKFSARLEGEYKFKANKKTTLNNVKYEADTNKGFIVRALVSYNVKF